MSSLDIFQKLLGSKSISINDSETIVGEKIRNGDLKTIDLVQALDPILTHADHVTRLEGVNILTKVIVSLPKVLLTTKEIEVLSEFLCLRLVDHKTMILPVLECLSYFVECDNKPINFNTTLLDFLKLKTNVQKMNPKERFMVYQIVKKIVLERRKTVASIDSDLVYTLIHMIEGESNPQNLLVCFGLVSYVMKNFLHLEPFIDDLFDWLSSYYPIDYTPSEAENSQYAVNIVRSDLVDALYDCFFATELNAANLQTILLEKLDSNMISTKLETLNCLIRCYETFNLKSIADYASSLWTSVRMDCLKKTTLVDKNLLETSYKALNALAKRLSEDEDLYFTFISDMYEELAIAFRKPEMELFEPAARLLATTVQPSTHRFNYVLGKILPIVINSLNAQDMRTISGTTYIFETISKAHPPLVLAEDLKSPMNLLVKQLVEIITSQHDVPQLLNAIIRCKIYLEDDTLKKLIEDLSAKMNHSLELEDCLALVCMNYDRADILSNETTVECKIGPLVNLISIEGDMSLSKFSVYLRVLLILFQDAEVDVMNGLNQTDLKFLFQKLRAKVLELMNQNITDCTAKVYAMALNKLSPANIDPLLMDLFSSNYCQQLIPSNDEEELSTKLYLSVIKGILHALVIRNHHMSAPLINLLLNFILSEKVGKSLALEGSQVFSHILSDESTFSREKHCQIFALYKQKLYMQISREIHVRYEIEKIPFRQHLLICTLAMLMPFVPPAAYRKDYEWIARQLLKIMRELDVADIVGAVDEKLLVNIYSCITCLIRKDTSGNFLGLLNTLVDLDVKFATQAMTLNVRKMALENLFGIASSFKDSELLLLRNIVVDKLKPCLSDKKRIVRQVAAQARLKWVLVGQPIGQ